MTHDEAISTGGAAAVRFGKDFVVYRFPAWPADVFSVIAVEKGLPPGTPTFETLRPQSERVFASMAEERRFKAAKKLLDEDKQRSLF